MGFPCFLFNLQESRTSTDGTSPSPEITSKSQDDLKDSKKSSSSSSSGSKLAERAKKKAWYNVIYPSYKSRSEDYKKLFTTVPEDERLVVGESKVKQLISIDCRLKFWEGFLCEGACEQASWMFFQVLILSVVTTDKSRKHFCRWITRHVLDNDASSVRKNENKNRFSCFVQFIC